MSGFGGGDNCRNYDDDDGLFFGILIIIGVGVFILNLPGMVVVHLFAIVSGIELHIGMRWTLSIICSCLLYLKLDKLYYKLNIPETSYFILCGILLLVGVLMSWKLDTNYQYSVIGYYIGGDVSVVASADNDPFHVSQTPVQDTEPSYYEVGKEYEFTGTLSWRDIGGETSPILDLNQPVKIEWAYHHMGQTQTGISSVSEIHLLRTSGLWDETLSESMNRQIRIKARIMSELDLKGYGLQFDIRTVQLMSIGNSSLSKETSGEMSPAVRYRDATLVGIWLCQTRNPEGITTRDYYHFTEAGRFTSRAVGGEQVSGSYRLNKRHIELHFQEIYPTVDASYDERRVVDATARGIVHELGDLSLVFSTFDATSGMTRKVECSATNYAEFRG